MDKFLSDRHLTTVFITETATGHSRTIEQGAYRQRLQILASIPPTCPKPKQNKPTPPQKYSTTELTDCN